MLQTKSITCKHCSAVNKHHSFQCSTIRKPIKSKEVKIEPNAVKRVPIKKVSDKRAKELRVYAKEKALHFKAEPACQFPGCESTDIELHHGAGRIGSLLTDRKYFKSLCHKHHVVTELNPEQAKELGLSFNRLIV